MSDSPVIRLSDYKPLDFLIEDVHLTFALHPTKTRVKSKITFVINPAATTRKLRLDGAEMALISCAIDGQALDLTPDDEGLDIPSEHLQNDRFIWECETEFSPKDNTSLDGLYMSNGMYCTQCEAQGFRKITFYPDRPDVMTVFTVRIESDLPVLLSNGNQVSSGEGWVEWHDPWPKPAYLFALVAGELVPHSDSFTTASNRKVDLNIYVRDGDQDKCAYAMDALKRSMKWDEDEYGREYDLDLFNIVAVDDFNMGAMENKGLNVFNSALVLASPETAADANYQGIERVIAHEYFHNWTGNRITCRDWFQLCLKEGLTVYRDQHFMSDMRDASVKRIEDVITLRGRQFGEDAGPLAHPPRPNQYIEINNFYTATVYEKGAEVVGMLRRLVGKKQYRKALDLYFERHDGQACTIEDWLTVFEDTTGRDLSQFKLWYTSAGTPRVKVNDDWNGSTYSLTLTQSTPATPDEAEKADRLIPVAVGLLYPDGSEAVSTTVLELSTTSETFAFDNLRERPIASILRDFSAPVILQHDIPNSERAFLLANDTDAFNKWEAGYGYSMDVLTRLANGGNDIDADLIDAIQKVALDDQLDPAFRALVLTLPSENAIAGEIYAKGGTPDPIAIHDARARLNTAIANGMASNLSDLYADMAVTGPFNPDAVSAGKRALRGRALSLISALDKTAETAKAQFKTATNMTEQFAALTQLVKLDQGADELAAFYDKWQDDFLVVNKWFGVQASATPAEKALDTVKRLTEHPAFDWKNPNRFRALLGGFVTGNAAAFHAKDGSGYDFFADWLIKLDPQNAQITARMCTVFDSWKRYSPERQAQIKGAMTRIKNTPNLSKNSSEIIEKLLAG